MGKGDVSADIMFYGGKIRLKAGSLVWNFFMCRVLHSIKLALCLVVQFSRGLCSREDDVGLGTATSIWAVEEVVYQSCSIKGPCAGGTFAPQHTQEPVVWCYQEAVVGSQNQDVTESGH